MARIVVLRGRVPDDAPKDEQDTRIQAQAISAALRRLGHDPVELEFSFDLARLEGALRRIAPDLVFNLVESVDGQGRFLHLAPAALDRFGIPYTGAGTDAIFQTSNKLVAKRVLRGAGLPTAPWISEAEADPEALGGARLIVKSIWEHASVGLDEGALILGEDLGLVRKELERRRSRLGGSCFAELYIEGREFNLSLLAGPDGPQVLPAAEIRFLDYPEGKPRIVDFRAKWDESSFEYRHTVRSYDFPPQDAPLLGRLSSIALDAWRLFGLRGYARLDFRVDPEGRPWVLEVNANPCLSPDAGFAAAADRARIPYEALIRRILEDAAPAAEAGTGAAGRDRAEIVLRDEVRPGDEASIRAIVRSTGFFSPAEEEIAIELAMERLDRGEASGYHFLLAERAGEVVGFSCFGPIPGTAASFDLYWIAVGARSRNVGVGTALLRASEERMAAAGARRIYVETSSRPQYEPTRAFYRRRGFREEAVLEDYYAPGDGKVILVKVLG